MKPVGHLRNLIIAAAALFAAGLASAPAPVLAAQQVLCAAETPASAINRRVTNPNTGTSYSLNGQGCGLIAQADIAWFLSQGFSPGTSILPVVFTTGTATTTTDFIIGNVPPGAYIREFVWNNLTATAVSGGIDVGTTANGSDVVSAQTCGASCLTFTADSALLKRVFSTTVSTPIHIAAHTTWQGANVTVTMIFGYF